MTSSGPRSALHRAALLLALALHLLGAADGAALHGWLRADPHAPGWSAQRHEAPFPAHDEQACVICQASAGGALPAPGAAAAPSLAAAAPGFVRVFVAASSPHRARLRARAPPAPTA